MGADSSVSAVAGGENEKNFLNKSLLIKSQVFFEKFFGNLLRYFWA